ncbi:MAG: Gfo/Idh/MocA family oxidoreductase [Planctomycetota bacterium]|nr:Gfo/Idh/MocA family oxidoreductase [Planctomycetota bacterium]
MNGATLNWGILGCGVFARKRILPAFANTACARLNAVQRRNLDEARATAAEAHVPAAYATRADLLADPSIQAVYVCTPNNLHLEDVRACAAAGKHVLCEKPLGLNAHECERMLTACQSANVKLFVGLCFRYTHAVERARALLASGALGELRAVRIWYSFLNPATAWRTDSRISGGGPLMDLGPHAFDFLRYLTGDEVATAQALVEPSADPVTGRCETEARALLRLKGGASASVDLSFREHFRNGFEVVGARSSLRGEYTLNQIVNQNVRMWRLTSDPTPPAVEELPLEGREVYRLQMDDVSRAILDPAHRPVCARGEDGLRAQQIIDAVYTAGLRGERVRLG